MIKSGACEVDITNGQILVNGNVVPSLDIHLAFERMCTAEYIMEKLNITDERIAYDKAIEVRRLMDKYGYSEDDAIDEVM